MTIFQCIKYGTGTLIWYRKFYTYCIVTHTQKKKNLTVLFKRLAIIQLMGIYFLMDATNYRKLLQ